MEENTTQVIIEVLKWLTAVSVASAPGIITLLRQNRKNKLEKQSKEDEARKITLDTTEKIQNIYQELIDDMKKSNQELQERVNKLAQDVENLRIENAELKAGNEKFIELIKTQDIEISTLKEKVGKLIDQIKTLGVKPIVDVTRPVKDVMKERSKMK